MNTTYYEIETRWSNTPDKWDAPNYLRVDEKYYKFENLEDAQAALDLFILFDKKTPKKDERYALGYRIVKRIQTVTVKDEEVIFLINNKQQEVHAMKKHKIGMKNYEYECGDGCCSESGTEWYVDGEYVTRSPCDLSSWMAILQHLGIEAEFVGLDENGEENWSL